MTTIKIDTDVPISGRVVASKYPFTDLQVGHSFLVPDDGTGSVATVRSRATKLNKTGDRHFTVRKTPEGHRVWRTA